MGNILFPTLSTDGWVDSPLVMADYLLSHFFVSEYSQTYLYIGQVSSLPYIIEEGNNNIPKTITLLQNTLSNYFGRYFNNVQVDVKETAESVDGSKSELTLYLGFTDENGIQYNMQNVLKLVNSKVAEIIKINNG